jgi:hypothetical protein
MPNEAEAVPGRECMHDLRTLDRNYGDEEGWTQH